MLVYWSLITGVSLTLVVCYNGDNTRKIDSTVRKYFHGLAILIFLPGIILTRQLMKIASVGAFMLFILTEVRHNRFQLIPISQLYHPI